MSYVGNQPAQTTIPADDAVTTAMLKDDAVTSAKIDDGTIATADIADDAVTVDKVANAINTSIAANTSKVTNATHTGDVTGATALTIATDAVDIAMLSATGTADATTFLRGDNAWVAVSGGLSHASIWRLNTSFTVTAGVESLISANLEEDDSTGAARIGAAMTESSGIFTFPATGIWRITSTGSWYYAAGGNTYAYIRNYSTIDDGTWVFVGYASEGLGSTVPQQGAGTSSFLLDVTDTSLCKVKFVGFSPNANGIAGETDKNRTTFEFYKLGDT